VKTNTYRWHGKDGLAEVFARMQRTALIMLEAKAAGGVEEAPAAGADETVPPVEQQTSSSPPKESNKTKGIVQICQKLIEIFLVAERVNISVAEAAEEVLGPLSPSEKADAAKAMKTMVCRMHVIANVLDVHRDLLKENVHSKSLQNKPSFKWVYHVLPSELKNHIPPPPPVTNVGVDASELSMTMIETAAVAAVAGEMPLAADKVNLSSTMLTAEELASQEEQSESMQVKI
jgi:hypothetical protein